MLGGLHHVTALASAAQSNLDFYTGPLGLRLVKRTVNFDDPATHHFYYSTSDGASGTLATFFPWGRFRPSRKGAGQITAMAFTGSAIALPFASSETRFGENVSSILDPDGIAVEIVARPGPAVLHSVTLCETALEPTADLLEFLGFAQITQEQNRSRFALPEQSGFIDILHEPSAERGRMGAGMIHHVAFRVADEATQLEWRARLLARGLQVSTVKDRQYFHSIYFREPGGVLFEIATDGPGFLVDESAAELGHALRLPPWLEPIRESVEQRLAPIHIPEPR